MALVVITLADNEDGSLDIQARAEPFIPTQEEQDQDGAVLTPAQTAAQVMVSAIASILQAGEEVASDETGEESAESAEE